MVTRQLGADSHYRLTNSTVYGGGGNDTLQGNSLSSTIYGGHADNFSGAITGGCGPWVKQRRVC